MEYRYNKSHAQVSVKAATVLGMLVGFWLGKRVGVASVAEPRLVFVGLFIVSNITFSTIDKKLLLLAQSQDN